MKVINFAKFLAVLIAAAPLSAMAGSHYEWFSSGNCHLVSGGGADRGSVDDGYCGGITYKWYSSGNCHMESLGGADRGSVDDGYCGGITYKWYSSGNCHMESLGGADRGSVDDGYCGGITYKWYSSGNCHMESLGGADRGVVGDTYCSGASIADMKPAKDALAILEPRGGNALADDEAVQKSLGNNYSAPEQGSEKRASARIAI